MEEKKVPVLVGGQELDIPEDILSSMLTEHFESKGISPYMPPDGVAVTVDGSLVDETLFRGERPTYKQKAFSDDVNLYLLGGKWWKTARFKIMRPVLTWNYLEGKKQDEMEQLAKYYGGKIASIHEVLLYFAYCVSQDESLGEILCDQPDQRDWFGLCTNEWRKYVSVGGSQKCREYNNDSANSVKAPRSISKCEYYDWAKIKGTVPYIVIPIAGEQD